MYLQSFQFKMFLKYFKPATVETKIGGALFLLGPRLPGRQYGREFESPETVAMEAAM